LDPSDLWHKYRLARQVTRGDFRGSRWGASSSEALQSEVENLREGWTGISTLFSFEVLFRYVFGPAGLRGGTYEFRLQMSEIDPAAAFQQVLDALQRQHGMPLYLQRTPVLLAPTSCLPPTSLLRSMAQRTGRCIAAWAIEASEILLIKDDTAVPLRLLYQARDESLYPDVSTQAMRAFQMRASLQ
jgi:hypothetical protein